MNEYKRVCIRCGIEKDITEYGKNSSKKDGLMVYCRQCIAWFGALYRKRNPEKIKEGQRKWQRENAEYVKTKRREKADENAEHIAKVAKAWRDANPDKLAEYSRLRRLKPKRRIENAVRSGIVRGIRVGEKSGRKTFALLGYSVAELMAHLEKQFQPGMTWDNYGDWHIDHIVPLSLFNYETLDDIDFKRAWALSNLQPLWALDNLKKMAKCDISFQPSLALAVPANDNKAPEKSKKKSA